MVKIGVIFMPFSNGVPRHSGSVDDYFTCIKYEVELIWAGLIPGIMDSDANLRINAKLMLCRSEKTRKRGLQAKSLYISHALNKT